MSSISRRRNGLMALSVIGAPVLGAVFSPSISRQDACFCYSPRGIVSLAARAVRGSLRGMPISSNPYRGFRFPREVIEHAVWLYHCFSLSLRDVELILAARGIVVSYESIREWGLRFGRIFANMLRWTPFARQPEPLLKV